ncbi:hypothetical protein, partial [Paraburkholderia sacchari]|uniref:hypothetical protein n=1 Tax=Paraburkholderia sacchari TaxID=159450 RepID=UPI001ABBB429
PVVRRLQRLRRLRLLTTGQNKRQRPAKLIVAAHCHQSRMRCHGQACNCHDVRSVVINRERDTVISGQVSCLLTSAPNVVQVILKESDALFIGSTVTS